MTTGDVFLPISSNRLYETVVERIRTQILEGTWKPGDKLPPERQLSQYWNIGRGPIREALVVLETLGWVEIRPGEGTFVKARTPGSISDATAQAVFHETPQAADLYEARELMETQLAALAAQRATAQDVVHLENALNQMRKAIAEGGSGMEADRAFHRALAQATGNPVFIQIQALFNRMLRQTMKEYFDVPGRSSRSVAEHEEVLDAIKKGDPKLARERMLKHLRSRLIDPSLDLVHELST